MSEKMSEEYVTEEEVKYYIFMKGGRQHFAPQYFSAGMTTVKGIFPVPKPNTIGTLDKYSNGIALIKFGDYGAEPDGQIVAQNFSKEVYGTDFIYRFCPISSEDTVIYSKTKIAVVANVKTGEAFHAGSRDLSERDFMSGIRFLDPSKNLFVIVKSIYDGVNGWEDHLHIVKLERQLFIETGWNVHIGKTDDILPDFPLYHKWFIHDSKLFVYDKGRILCTDGSQPVSHPFSEVFNCNSDHIGNIRDLAIHPTLPFGVMIEDYVSGSISQQLTTVCWEAKKPKGQIVALNDVFEPLAPLFGLNRIAFAYQSFSPAGDWYIVGCLTLEAVAAPEESKAPFFIAIPVDDERPNFLVVEELIVLGQVKNMTSLAWTTSLASYVVSNGELLHKWDLDELPVAREFVVPADGGKKHGKPIFRKIKDLIGL
jgi:hypothetical protein